MWKEYALTIGLPQTSYRNLAEPRLLMEACNMFWWALGETIQRPISQLRTAAGEPVYATIMFVDDLFPLDRSLSTFQLDDRLRFIIGLRAIKNLAIEGLVVFDREDRLVAGAGRDAWWTETPSYPLIRFGSIFATPGPENAQLKLAQPVNADFRTLSALPPNDSPLQVARRAQETGRLDVIPEDWVTLDVEGATELTYAIDPDRDTNAAGLVYFANYVAMLERGECLAIPRPTRSSHPSATINLAARRLRRRRIVYLGNAGLSDQVRISVARFGNPAEPNTLGLRYRLTRMSDDKLICLSEALLFLAPEPSPIGPRVPMGQQAGAR